MTVDYQGCVFIGESRRILCVDRFVVWLEIIRKPLFNVFDFHAELEISSNVLIDLNFTIKKAY